MAVKLKGAHSQSTPRQQEESMLDASLINVEGPEGSGKTTNKNKTVEFLKSKGYEVITGRDPGGTEISEEIREIILKNREYAEMTKDAEVLLYEAARSQLVENFLKPASKNNDFIVLDRYFDSTTAYQGYGRRIDLEFIKMLNKRVISSITPDRTYLLDVSPEIGLKRCGKDEFSADGGDRMEQSSLDFHHRVRDGFLKIADGNNRIKVIDTEENNEEQVFKIIKDDLREQFEI